MREILFRGKTVCNGDWVYGGITWNPSRKKVFIHTKSDECEVIPETVGQYTGLKDVHGTMVFEGDIVKDITERYISKEKKIFGIAIVKFGKHEVRSEDPFCYGDAYGWYFDGTTVKPQFSITATMSM